VIKEALNARLSDAGEPHTCDSVIACIHVSRTGCFQRRRSWCLDPRGDSSPGLSKYYDACSDVAHVCLF
jgi:hypothetical protein